MFHHDIERYGIEAVQGFNPVNEMRCIPSGENHPIFKKLREEGEKGLMEGASISSLDCFSVSPGDADESEKRDMYRIFADPSGPGVGNVCRLVNDATVLARDAPPHSYPSVSNVECWMPTTLLCMLCANQMCD